MPVDYDALASQHGGTVAVDYDALASQHGGSAAAAPEPASAGTRFVKGAASQLTGAVTGAANAVMHPIDTLGGIIDAHIDQAKKAKHAYDEGRYTEAAGHLGAAGLPVVGPAAAGIGERIAQTGDIATGVGEGAGLIASLGAPKVIPPALRGVGRAGEAVSGVVRAAADTDLARAVAAKTLKHGATVAGAVTGGTVAGAPGAFLGGTLGRELGASLAERVRTGAKTAPVAASSAELVADMASGRPMDASTYIERLNRLSPEQRAQVITARQAAVKGAPPAETPAELSQRVKAEHRAAQPAPNDLMAQFQASQGPQQEFLQPNAEGGVTRMRMNAEGSHVAVPEAPGMTPAPVAAQTPPPAEIVKPAPAVPAEPPVRKPFNPSTANAAARKAFEGIGQTPAKGEVTWAAEYMRRGATPEEAVAKVVATRRGMPSPVDPAAELAARLGTPSVSQMEQAVAARNATGRWQ